MEPGPRAARRQPSPRCRQCVGEENGAARAAGSRSPTRKDGRAAGRGGAAGTGWGSQKWFAFPKCPEKFPA